jgi:hypothetical protein
MERMMMHGTLTTWLTRGSKWLAAAALVVAAPEIPSAEATVPCPHCVHSVDGHCPPNVHSYGHYQTRWRRWPAAPFDAAPDRAPRLLDPPPFDPLPPDLEEPPIRRPRPAVPGDVPPTQPPSANGDLKLPTPEDPFIDDPNQGLGRVTPMMLPDLLLHDPAPAPDGVNPTSVTMPRIVPVSGAGAAGRAALHLDLQPSRDAADLLQPVEPPTRRPSFFRSTPDSTKAEAAGANPLRGDWSARRATGDRSDSSEGNPLRR